MGEAIDYVKKQAATITRLLSKEHHKIIDQYFYLRSINQQRTDQTEKLKE